MSPLQILVITTCAVMVAAMNPPVIPPERPPPEIPIIDPGELEGGVSGPSADAGDVCTQPKTPGPCDESIPRFFYNRDTFTCEPFEYSGCWGNDNNFPSLEACLMVCVMPPDNGGHPPGVFFDKLFPDYD